MCSIATAVARIKDDPQAVLNPSICEAVCSELGLEWRCSVLTPPVTLGLLAQQVLAGHVSNPELIRRTGMTITPAAYCIAKQRLPVEAVCELSRRVCQAAERQRPGSAEDRWKGHRTWHVDGSSFSMPDTPELQSHFGQPAHQKPGCGFPVAHLLCLFAAATGLLKQVIVSRLRTSDAATVPQVHAALGRGDVVIADRAFGSYFHLALLWLRGVLGVFPVQYQRIVSFRRNRRFSRPNRKHRRAGQPTSRWLKSLGRLDQLVMYFKPPRRPAWMSLQQYQAMPESLVVREIRRTLIRRGFRPRNLTITTTLLDPQLYPAHEVLGLLEQRWQIETNLRHLKTTMGLQTLRCQCVQGVQRELWAFVLIYNLVRVIMLEAAADQGVDPARISFADALYWMRYARPGHSLPKLLVNPHRPNRSQPRVVKRRIKYPYLKKNRRSYPTYASHSTNILF